jgi:predicted ATPase
MMLGDPEQAAMLAAQAIATADEHGFRDVDSWARMLRGWAQAQLGHPDKGASLIRDALAGYRANGSLVTVPSYLTWLAEAQAVGGALADGLRTLDEALTVNPEEGCGVPRRCGCTAKSAVNHARLHWRKPISATRSC